MIKEGIGYDVWKPKEGKNRSRSIRRSDKRHRTKKSTNGQRGAIDVVCRYELPNHKKKKHLSPGRQALSIGSTRNKRIEEGDEDLVYKQATINKRGDGDTVCKEVR